MGYRAKTDWLPTRIALCDSSGREVDVHPIVLEDDGSAWLPGLDGTRFVYPRDSFGRGMVGDCEVPCISAELQIAFHSGYPPQPKDLADIAALRSAGLVAEAAAQADVDASD
jgi:lincosamide nucleotidyltransferase A/C/D/E